MEALKLESVKGIQALISQGQKFRSRLVVTSKKTGRDLTFEVKGFKGRSGYVAMVGYEKGYADFQYCGLWNPHTREVYPFQKFRNSDSEIVKGSIFVLKNLAKDPEKLLEQTTITHTGSCLKCGRELTDAGSISSGFGPVCRSMLG